MEEKISTGLAEETGIRKTPFMSETVAVVEPFSEMETPGKALPALSFTTPEIILFSCAVPVRLQIPASMTRSSRIVAFVIADCLIVN